MAIQCGTDDEATKIQKGIFLKLKARVSSLEARSAASHMLGYTCELEIKHYHRTFPSTHANCNSYSWRVPSSTLPGGRPSLSVSASLCLVWFGLVTTSALRQSEQA